MDTLAPTATCRHTRIRLSTERPSEFIDITDGLIDWVSDTGLAVGVVNVQTLHTTTAIVVNEHEPLLLADLEALLERVASRDGLYRHDDVATRRVNLTAGERPNGHAHCRALVMPSSVSLNVVEGRLQLGRWQRVFLVELDGPREREISVLALGESER